VSRYLHFFNTETDAVAFDLTIRLRLLGSTPTSNQSINCGN